MLLSQAIMRDLYNPSEEDKEIKSNKKAKT